MAVKKREGAKIKVIFGGKQYFTFGEGKESRVVDW